MGARVRKSGSVPQRGVDGAGLQFVEVGLPLGEPAGKGASRTLLDRVAFPLPPSINHYWASRVVESKGRRLPNGKGVMIPITYTSTEGKQYQQMVMDRLLELGAWYRSDRKLEIELLVRFPNEVRRDLSNYLKVLEDALKNGHLFEDDSQVERWEIRRGPNMDPPCVVITVREIISDRGRNLLWIAREG